MAHKLESSENLRRKYNFTRQTLNPDRNYYLSSMKINDIFKKKKKDCLKVSRIKSLNTFIPYFEKVGEDRSKC